MKTRQTKAQLELAKSRRNFLSSVAKVAGALGISTSGFDLIAGNVLKKTFGQAMAAGEVGSEYIYVHFSFSGGPPRWYMDLPLNPENKADQFIAGGFGNTLVWKSGKVDSVHTGIPYKNKAGKTTHIPPVWGMSLPSTNIQDLLPNTLFIRGMDMEIDNHPISNQRQVAPIIGGLSVTGLVADASKKPIPGLTGSSPSSTVFKSAKGLASVSNPGGATPLATLLKPFAPFAAGTAVQAKEWATLRNNALARFDQYAAKNGLPETTLRLAYDDATKMIENNVYELNTQYAATVAKYKDLMDRALSLAEVKRLFPNPIVGEDTPHFSIDTDVRAKDADLRNAFEAGARISNGAEDFAMAEILLKNDLTSSLTLGIGNGAGLVNLKVNGATFNMTNDQHRIGKVPSTLFTTMQYRAFLTMVTELAKVLKDENKWDKTVFHIAGEWNRSPRADGSGADHGVRGSCTTLMSGMIKDFNLIGNVSRQSGADRWPGTWGVAANYGPERPIQVNDVAATLASLMRLNSMGLITNGTPLLNPLTGIPYLLEARNV